MNHAERYEKLIQLTGKEADHDYQAACYLLASSRELYDITCRMIDRVGIKFDEIKKESLPILNENQQKVLAVAENLFFYQSEGQVSPYEISRLGYPFMELACKAILVASGDFSLKVNRESNFIELDSLHYQAKSRVQARIASLLQGKDEEAGEER